MSVCLITALTDSEWERARGTWTKDDGSYGGSRNAPAMLKAHPLAAFPKLRVPAYRDPAKARTLDQIVAELTKRQDKAFETERGIRGLVEAARGEWGITPGYRLTVSDGCFAWGVPGTALGKHLGAGARPLGRLDAIMWRDYAPVRPFANERSGAILWAFGGDRVSWSANGQPDLGEGRSWAPGRFTTAGAAILLADDYLWLCRGRSWDLAITNDAIILTDPAGAGQLIVMGMRDR